MINRKMPRCIKQIQSVICFCLERFLEKSLFLELLFEKTGDSGLDEMKYVSYTRQNEIFFLLFTITVVRFFDVTLSDK